MSAQRRTTTKERAVPASNGSPAAPAPKTRDASVAARGKAIVETRQSIFAARTASLRAMLRDTHSEIKKVNWPDSQTTKSLTVVVIGISIALGAMLGSIDYILRKLFEAMS